MVLVKKLYCDNATPQDDRADGTIRKVREGILQQPPKFSSPTLCHFRVPISHPLIRNLPSFPSSLCCLVAVLGPGLTHRKDEWQGEQQSHSACLLHGMVSYMAGAGDDDVHAVWTKTYPSSSHAGHYLSGVDPPIATLSTFVGITAN